jgi:hypothetical protein
MISARSRIGTIYRFDFCAGVFAAAGMRLLFQTPFKMTNIFSRSLISKQHEKAA